MNKLVVGLMICLSMASAAVMAQGYSTSETEIGALLDDPAAAAILESNMPGFTTNDQITMARSLTLRALQSFASDSITDEKLDKIDEDFKKMGAKK